MPPKKRPAEVLQARGRLSALGNTDGEQSDSATAKSMPGVGSAAVPTRGRPPKRPRKNADAASVADGDRPHQSFIMKLFDRSLDLAKYPPNSALYPICRAWMLNQPRSNKLINFKTRILPDPEKREAHSQIDDLRTGKLTEVHTMPAILRSSGVDRIPKPLPVDGKEVNPDFSRDLNAQKVSRDELLVALKKRSSVVRKNWQAHTQEYQERTYRQSFQLLEHIYKQ